MNMDTTRLMILAIGVLLVSISLLKRTQVAMDSAIDSATDTPDNLGIPTNDYSRLTLAGIVVGLLLMGFALLSSL